MIVNLLIERFIICFNKCKWFNLKEKLVHNLEIDWNAMFV